MLCSCFQTPQTKVGAHTYTAEGLESEHEWNLHINFPEPKAVRLDLRRFEHLCWGQVIVFGMKNTTEVSYINEEEDMKSGSLSMPFFGDPYYGETSGR